MSVEVRRVKAATDFQAAGDTGGIVEFEIAYAYALRSDKAAEFLKSALRTCSKKSVSGRRAGAAETLATNDASTDLGVPAWRDSHLGGGACRSKIPVGLMRKREAH